MRCCSSRHGFYCHDRWKGDQSICIDFRIKLLVVEKTSTRKTPMDLRWRRGSRDSSKKFDVVQEWIFQNLYFDTIYLISTYNAKIIDHIMEETTTSRWRFDLFVIWRCSYNRWKLAVSLTISFERISRLDFFSKNIYSSYLESGQCYTTKKSTKKNRKSHWKDDNQMQMVLH